MFKTKKRIATFVLISITPWTFVWGFSESNVKSLMKGYGVTPSEVSLYATVLDGNKDRILLDINAHEPRIPASVSKLAVSATVLDEFKAGHLFVTKLTSKSKITNGVLEGDLYLLGGGDPSFVSEKMWYLVNEFIRNGIHTIQGNIIVDDSLFDAQRIDPTRLNKRVDNAYDAPVGAMSFNWNSVNIFVRPAKVGRPNLVYIDPENQYIRLVNKSTTVKGSGDKLVASRVESSTFPGDVVVIDGTLGENYRERRIFRNITQPDLWSGFNLKSFLEQRGVKVKGEIKIGKSPKEVDVLAEASSKPIEQILEDMNVFSNNYVAEMLVKNISALHSSPGTLKEGMDVVNEYLKKIEIPEKEFHLMNPSGLSRENRLSSYALWKILNVLHKNFSVQPEFLSSLPIAGREGTLKKRFVGTKGEGWIRGKTGSLDGVVSLAGYLGSAEGQVIIFSFIYNGAKAENDMRAFFDKLILEL